MHFEAQMGPHVCCLEAFWLCYRPASGMGWLIVFGSYQHGTWGSEQPPAQAPEGVLPVPQVPDCS